MKEPSVSLTACVLITALSFMDPADAHSWYDADCCGDTDCHRVPCDEISEEPDGFHWQYGPRRVDELVFARSKLRPSRDGYCHVCHQDLHDKPSIPAGWMLLGYAADPNGYHARLPRRASAPR
jgi:hypothetical protein